MSSFSRSLRKLSGLSTRILPLLCLLLIWTLFTGTGLYWGGGKIYESLWLFYVSAGLWLVLGAHAMLAWFQGKRIGGWVDVAVLSFLAYSAVWYHFAPIEFLARVEGLWILSYAAVFLSVRYVFPQRGWLIALLAGFLVVAVICCSFALSKHGQFTYEIWGEARPDYGVRISGFFGCPNHFGNYMVMGALVALVLAGINSFPWVLRICLFYVACMLSAGVFLSISRGSYAAWLTGILVVSGVFFSRSVLGWVWKLAVAIGLVSAVAGAFVVNRAAVARGSQMFYDDFRFELFAEAWKMWQRHPFFGHGPATFDYAHQQFHGPAFTSRAYFTHNDYLNTLCDYGSVGLVLVLIFVVLLFFAFRCPRESTPTERQQDLQVLGWAALAAMLVHSMTDFNFHIPACGLAFFAIMGVASSRTERQQRAPLCLPLNFLIAGTAFTAVFFLVTATWKTQEAKAILPYSDDGLIELQPDKLGLLVGAARRWDPDSPAITVRSGDSLRVRVAGLEEKIDRLRQSTSVSEKEAAELQDMLIKRHEIGEQALDLYRLAEGSNPLDDSIRIKEGMVLDLMDRPQEAYLYYQQALQKQPTNRFFLHVIGYHFLRENNLPKAKECFLEVLSIGPGRGERNRETLDQATQALQMIERLEKQKAAPMPSPSPPAAAKPPVLLPEPMPAPLPVQPAPSPEPESPRPKRASPDQPILGPAR